MSWQAFQMVFRMESPLHSGCGKIGNIQRTRLYVTGRMLWGALTANIARLLKSSDYVQVGNMVKEHLRTSYLFPCLDQEGKSPIMPLVCDHSVHYRVGDKNVKAALVESWLLTSYASTATDAASQAAQDGTLHEVELVSNRFLRGWSENGIRIFAPGDPVYLSGVLFLSSNAPDDLADHWESALSSLQVGGERGYGFGLLTLVDKPLPTRTVFGYPVELVGNEPDVTLAKGEPAPAHVIAENDMNLQGPIEPLLGRETLSDGQFGRSISLADVCWIPGATSLETKTFYVKEKGLWRLSANTC